MTRRRSSPAPLREHLGFEEAEDGSVLVLRDGRPQSLVDLDDPTRLDFPYVQHLAWVLDTVPPAAPERIAVTHVGGAGLTLPRYVQHTRPGSPQIVLEPDAELTDAVRADLPLPRGHRIRVRPQDGATGATALKDASADAVVVDAFDDGEVPGELLEVAFLAACHRVVRPGGVLAVNLSDSPGLPATRGLARTASQAGWTGPLVRVSSREVARGKQPGNVVLVARRTPEAIGTGAGGARGGQDTAWVDALRARAATASLPTEVATL